MDGQESEKPQKVRNKETVKILRKTKYSVKISKDELIKIIVDLKKSFLLYSNADFSEIISIIDTYIV